MMPDDASPADFGKVKGKFLKSLRRWAKRQGVKAELHGILHVQGRTRAHWDVVCWTDASLTKLHEHFGGAWRRVGGHRQSLVVVAESGDLDAVAAYQAKPVARDRGTPHYLPAFRSAGFGLELTWQTAGFWAESSLDAVWAELIAEWFPSPAPIKETELTTPPSEGEGGIPVYIPGKSTHWDRANFARRLPGEAKHAVGIGTYAAQWGVSPDYMLGIIQTIPGIVKTSGELVEGSHHFNGWYLPQV